MSSKVSKRSGRVPSHCALRQSSWCLEALFVSIAKFALVKRSAV
jgi:hypothetical protein